MKKAEVGFEPTNHGFAIRSLSPLGYSAESEEDTRHPGRRRGQALRGRARLILCL